MSNASPSPVPKGDTGEKRTARSLIATRHKHLGRDAEGFHHHADEIVGVVFRISPSGEIERRTDLDDAHLDRYIDFVACEVGWEDRRVIKADRIWGAFR